MSGKPKFNQSKEPKKFNLRKENDKPLNIDVSTIPTQSPIKVLNEFGFSDEEDPYFKIQKIDFPIKANGYNYTEEFFKSFTEKLNTRPFPGAKDGHHMSWGGRPNTDLLLVGSKIESKGKGKGSVYLKNWIPVKIGDSDNERFIKENKAGLVDYSLVSWTKDERIENPDGSVTWNVVESIRGERNDAVEFGGGAMEQKTNSHGALDDKKGEKMDKEEILKALLTLKTNNGIDLIEIAKHLGLDSLLVSEDQKTNLAVYDAVVKVCGEVSPVDFINGLLGEKKENAVKVREAKFNEMFGSKVHETTKKENTYRTYAETYFGDSELTKEKVNAFKEDSIAKKLAAEYASIDSDENNFGEEVDGKKKNKVVATTETVEY